MQYDVLVQEYDIVSAGVLESNIVADAITIVSVETMHLHVVVRRCPVGSAVRRTVVDEQHFVGPVEVLVRERGETLVNISPAVPAEHDHCHDRLRVHAGTWARTDGSLAITR